MLTKIDATIKYGKQHGGFGIRILYPGLALPQLNDTGVSTIGRIDHARIVPGTLVPMHPHRDDEILTYLRAGKVLHRDSEGLTAIISSQHLMMMNAGPKFQHEELVLEDGGVLEGLQIFIRPETAGLKQQVQLQVNEDILLAAGEGVLIENEEPVFSALAISDIVLFMARTDATHFDGGMYSGNLQ